MKQNINEIKRMQQLAGIISESQLSETMYYVYDKEGLEEPIGPFTMDQAKQELAKQGPEWGIMDEKTAKEVYTYLEDDMSETKNKEEESFGGINEDVNKVLTSGGFDPIEDDGLLAKVTKVLSLIGGSPSAEAINALTMVIEDAEGENIDWN